MKKVKAETADELRPEYNRSDFGELVRGKYADRIKEESNVVLLEPDIAQAFPNDEAVNKAKPGKEASLLNFIGAMFQFQGGISEADKAVLVSELQRRKWLSIDSKGHVVYKE